MNRQQRRAESRTGSNTMVLKRILLTFEDETSTLLDTSKVMIVDRDTGEPLFDEVLEPIGDTNLDPSAVHPKGSAVVDVVDFPTTPHQEFKDEPDEQVYSTTFDTPEGMMEYVKKGNWSGVRPVKE